MIKHTPLPNGNHPISSPICPMGVADSLEPYQILYVPISVKILAIFGSLTGQVCCNYCLHANKKRKGSVVVVYVQPKPGFSIGNRNQGPILVLVSEQKLFFSKKNLEEIQDQITICAKREIKVKKEIKV